MKILKIFLILLLPAMGLVGCKKSDHRPGSCSNHSSKQTNNETVNAKLTDSADELIDESSPVVGSGDDDRDGGDKKQKKVR